MPKTLKIPIFPLFVAAALLILAGCHSAAPFESAYDPEQVLAGEFQVASRTDLARQVADQSEAVDRLRVEFGVTVRRGHKRVLPSFTAVALYEQPDKIKLGLRRFEIGTVYSILILGDEAKLYANREGRMFYGSLDELAAKLPLLSGLSPKDLVTAVTVQRELSDVLNGSEQVAVLDQGSHFLVARRHPASGRQFFWLVRKADALVEEVLIRDAQGRDELRIRYDSYELVDNETTGTKLPYPKTMTFHLIRQKLLVEAEVKSYRLAPEFPEGIWALPRAKESYRLRDVTFEEL